MDPKSINQSLIKAYELVKNFAGMPDNPLEQKTLIRVYYKHLLNHKPLSKVNKSQAYCVAKRLYCQAFFKIAQLSSQEKSALDTLFEYEKAKSLGDCDKTEELEERICIQLENENGESLVVQEIQRALFPKNH